MYLFIKKTVFIREFNHRRIVIISVSVHLGILFIREPDQHFAVVGSRKETDEGINSVIDAVKDCFVVLHFPDLIQPLMS